MKKTKSLKARSARPSATVEQRCDLLERHLDKLLFFWAEYTSQEMYGEHLRWGLGGDFTPWDDAHSKARHALRSAGRMASKASAAKAAPKKGNPHD